MMWGAIPSPIFESIVPEAEFETLARFGVDYGQGYFIARPKRALDIEPYFPQEPEKIVPPLVRPVPDKPPVGGDHDAEKDTGS